MGSSMARGLSLWRSGGVPWQDGRSCPVVGVGMRQGWIAGVVSLGLSLAVGSPGFTQDAKALQQQFAQEMLPEFKNSCGSSATAAGDDGPEQAFAVSFCHAVATGVTRCLVTQMQRQNQVFSRMATAIAARKSVDDPSLMPSDQQLEEMTFGCIQRMLEVAQPTWDNLFPLSP